MKQVYWLELSEQEKYQLQGGDTVDNGYSFSWAISFFKWISGR